MLLFENESKGNAMDLTKCQIDAVSRWFPVSHLLNSILVFLNQMRVVVDNILMQGAMGDRLCWYPLAQRLHVIPVTPSLQGHCPVV